MEHHKAWQCKVNELLLQIGFVLGDILSQRLEERRTLQEQSNIFTDFSSSLQQDEDMPIVQYSVNDTRAQSDNIEVCNVQQEDSPENKATATNCHSDTTPFSAPEVEPSSPMENVFFIEARSRNGTAYTDTSTQSACSKKEKNDEVFAPSSVTADEPVQITLDTEGVKAVSEALSESVLHHMVSKSSTLLHLFLGCYNTACGYTAGV